MKVAHQGWADSESNTFGRDFDSSALSNATHKKVAEIRQVEIGAKAERSEVVEVGGSGGSPGGWVLASTRRETEKRHCGSGAVVVFCE